jgi:hypothetical protein
MTSAWDALRLTMFNSKKIKHLGNKRSGKTRLAPAKFRILVQSPHYQRKSFWHKNPPKKREEGQKINILPIFTPMSMPKHPIFAKQG